MTTDQAKTILNANKDRVAIFISDPTKGDQIIITSHAVFLPRTCEGTDIATCGDLLNTLDFNTYNGNGPKVTVKRA